MTENDTDNDTAEQYSLGGERTFGMTVNGEEYVLDELRDSGTEAVFRPKGSHGGVRSQEGDASVTLHLSDGIGLDSVLQSQGDVPTISVLSDPHTNMRHGATDQGPK